MASWNCFLGPRHGEPRVVEALDVSSLEAGTIERVIGEQPEVDLVSLLDVDEVEHASFGNGLAHRGLVKVEVRLRERRLQAGRNMGRRVVDRHHDVDIVRRARLALQARGHRSGDHLLDPGLVETADDELQ